MVGTPSLVSQFASSPPFVRRVFESQRSESRRRQRRLDDGARLFQTEGEVVSLMAELDLRRLACFVGHAFGGILEGFLKCLGDGADELRVMATGFSLDMDIIRNDVRRLPRSLACSVAERADVGGPFTFRTLDSAEPTVCLKTSAKARPATTVAEIPRWG